MTPHSFKKEKKTYFNPWLSYKSDMIHAAELTLSSSPASLLRPLLCHRSWRFVGIEADWGSRRSYVEKCKYLNPQTESSTKILENANILNAHKSLCRICGRKVSLTPVIVIPVFNVCIAIKAWQHVSQFFRKYTSVFIARYKTDAGSL